MAGLRVAMRADASAAIGAGHVARCLTLAAVVRSRGGRVRMLGRSLPDRLRSWIEAAGHEFVGLVGRAEPPDADIVHGAWLGTSQTADALDTAAALSGTAWDWIVVDHYAIGARWETAMRAAVGRVVAIDDMADRQHDCDILLDQNLPAVPARYAPRVPATCQLLLGPAFALVRDEFRRARAEARARDGVVRRVLVFMGGWDADNHTARAVDACIAAGLGHGQVDVVVGAEYAHAASIQDVCARAGYNCEVQTSRMADLMRVADLAIGAAGSASWERCAVGLPTIALSTALNQRAILDGLAACGAVLALPADAPASVEAMTAALLGARRDPVRMRAMSEAAWRLVDGGGADRVCDAMEAAA